MKSLKLDDNTVVLFASDNGHELYYGPKDDYRNQRLPGGESANLTDKKWRTREHGDVFDGAGGRAGLKRSGYQGGMQCPLIVRWPDKIPCGSETSLLSSHYDFLATLADLVGEKVPDGKDGISYVPTLLGQPQTQLHDFVVINNNKTTMGSSALITREGLKLVEADRKQGVFQLYDILKDNEERNDLASQFPEKVDRLKQILKQETNSERPDLQFSQP
jgi:arylsulfatase A-like enzyme